MLIREAKEQGKQLDPRSCAERCGRVVVHGCLEPPIPGQEIILKYVDPARQCHLSHGEDG